MNVRTFLQTPLAKIAACSLVGIGSWFANDWLDKTPVIGSTTPAWFAGSSGGSQAPAVRQVEREFTIAGGFTTTAGLLLLNSTQDYTDPQGITAVVSSQRFPAAGTDAQALVGRTIRVKGRPSTYKGRPQILVDQFTIK